jgi:hypothetical protein
MVLSKSQKFEIAKKKEYTSLEELSSEYEVSKATISRALRYVKDNESGIVDSVDDAPETFVLNDNISEESINSESNNTEINELTIENIEKFELTNDIDSNTLRNNQLSPTEPNDPSDMDDMISNLEFQETDNPTSFEQVLNPVIEEDEELEIPQAPIEQMSDETLNNLVEGILDKQGGDIGNDISHMMQNEPTRQQQQTYIEPDVAPPKLTHSQQLDDKHISAVNQIVQYLNEFQDVLGDIYMGQTKKVFVKSLIKKQPYELQLLLSQIKSTINQKNTQMMMGTAFTSSIAAIEYFGCEYAGLKIYGLSDLFNKNRQVRGQIGLCFKELSIKHSRSIEESGIMEPEVKMLTIVCGAIMTLHTDNSLNSGLDKFKEETVKEGMEDKYGDI